MAAKYIHTACDLLTAEESIKQHQGHENNIKLERNIPMPTTPPLVFATSPLINASAPSNFTTPASIGRNELDRKTVLNDIRTAASMKINCVCHSSYPETRTHSLFPKSVDV